MRILHVGWGFSPWRSGGLIQYAEDLMAAQVRSGHEVAYFFSGRHYPRLSGPRLKRWRRDGVAMYEVINSSIVSGLELGTSDPEGELDEPRVEAGFARVLAEFDPDVVHIQELLCLPSALVDVARGAGVGTVMTLQDYFPLCPTLRLIDADGAICTRLDVGGDCVARNVDAPTSATPFIVDTLKFEVRRLRDTFHVSPRVNFGVINPLMRRFYDWALRNTEPPFDPSRDRPPSAPENPRLAAAFQRRRDVNVKRLGRVDRLVAQSERVAEIYRDRGVSNDSLASLRLTLPHIEQLRPRVLAEPPVPITFATLGGCASPTKGSQVVVDALEALRERGLEGRFRLHVWGFVHESARDCLAGYDGAETLGPYGRDSLDAVLDAVDVGLMPSMWEEAFGYTGVEMLAKGVPLVANALGGMVEYAIEGESAWLNRSCTGGGLADLMAMLIADPALVLAMHKRILAARDRHVLPWSTHLADIEALYADVADKDKRRPTLPPMPSGET